MVVSDIATGSLITFSVVPNQVSSLPASPALPRYPTDQDRPFELLKLDPFIGFDAAQNVHVTRAASYVANARTHVILLGGVANTSIKGFAFEEDTDRPLYVLPDIAPLPFFPTPVDITSPYYTTYGGDDGKEQAMVRFVV